jgi:hypothetical protein
VCIPADVLAHLVQLLAAFEDGGLQVCDAIGQLLALSLQASHVLAHAGLVVGTAGGIALGRGSIHKESSEYAPSPASVVDSDMHTR